MLTQAMPAFTNAIRDASTPTQLAQLTRALGNCQQPLAHRGPVSFLPPTNRSRPRNGVNDGWSPAAPGSPPGFIINNYGFGPWNPQFYPGLIPNAGTPLYPPSVDIGQMPNGGPWNTGNSYGSEFNFPTDQHFTTNQYYGGPQFYVTNNAYIENINSQNIAGDQINAGDLNTTTINGRPVVGPAGPAGRVGPAGRDGLAGPAGSSGIDGGGLFGAFSELRYLTGWPPRVLPERKNLAVPKTEIKDVVVVDQALFTVPTAVTFDPDSCVVSFSGTTQFYATPADHGPGVVLSSVTSSDGQAPKSVLSCNPVRYANVQVMSGARLGGIWPASALVFQR